MSTTIYCGDALSLLRTLPDGFARCVVTSPPYWGLRDYGTGAWEGGEADCQHRGRPKPRQDTSGAPGLEHGRFAATRGTQPAKAVATIPVRDVCRCGARRVDRQLGLEPTPESYVSRMVEVFREVRRVLADDGTLWLNLGDSYAAAWPCRRPERSEIGAGSLEDGTRAARPPRLGEGLKTKDLIGIPWRVAFALQADGWYLRSDIIWSKPNPMPESVRDRPTKAHEYVFLLSKRERYYYDAEAVRESRASERSAGVAGWAAGQGDHSAVGFARDKGDARTFRGGQYVGGNKFQNSHAAQRTSHGNQESLRSDRNRRTVWTIATQPYPEAHFATFPPALVEPCILAGSAPGDTVLDPFAGAGTTGLVARRLGRDFVGIELNPEYAEMARRRIRDDAPLLNHVSVVAEEPAS